ncbi:rCG51312 [Rattus norvegicus]|uniref:RCG51312 n=1 Tax=Rattus norvegicus TaxID=10116 RepID=A6IZD5_RAT|nr:rCG51312 [Rattus norvegicus]
MGCRQQEHHFIQILLCGLVFGRTEDEFRNYPDIQIQMCDFHQIVLLRCLPFFLNIQ